MNSIKPILLSLLLLVVFPLTGQAKNKTQGKALCVSIFQGPYTGAFSSPEQLRQKEKDMYNSTKQRLGVELAPGSFDTKNMQKRHQEFGRINEDWGNHRDKGQHRASLLINQASLAKKQGIHAAEHYGRETYEEFIYQAEFMDSIPNHSFKLSKELWAEAHRKGGRSAMMWAQRVAKNPLLAPVLEVLGLKKLFYQGGGTYRGARSRLYDDALTKTQLKNILSTLDELLAVGVFPHVKKGTKLYDLYSIKDTHWSTGFRKPSENGNGTYDVVMSYPSPKIVAEAMESIFKWANEEMYKIDNHLEGARDPIELAAITQYAMVYVHAAKDGNGRVTKAFKNKILEKYGLGPDMRVGTEAWHDLDLRMERFVDGVREGVLYTTETFANMKPEKPPTAIDAKLGLEVGKHNLSGVDRNMKRFISDKALPKSYRQILEIGRDTTLDVVFRGNFFQTEHGVLYQYVPSERALYPISDWSATLYGMGGKLYQKKTRVNTYNFRRPNEVFNRHINDNIALFKGLVEGEIDSRSIKIMPFDILTPHHDGFGKIYLQHFQKDLVKAALNSDKWLDPVEYPLAILSPNRGNQISPKRSGPTNLQIQFVKNGKDPIHFGPIMGAYQLRRSFLIKLDQDLKETDPALYKQVEWDIYDARYRAYKASRTMLLPFIEYINAVFNDTPGKSSHPELAGAKDFHKWARNHELYKGMYEYMKTQEWAYEKFADAIKEVDQDSTFVIRNVAIKNVKFMGLISEAEQARFARKWLPFIENMAKQVDAEIKRSNKTGEKLNPEQIKGFFAKRLGRFVSEYDKNGDKKTTDKKRLRREMRDGIDKAVEGVFAHEYQARGAEVEFQRPFMDLYLHTVGFHPQVMKSTTVDPFYNWILNSLNQLKFYPGGMTVFYKLRINDEATDAKFSPYTAQNEVVDRSELWPKELKKRTLFSATEDQLKLKLDEDKQFPEFEKTYMQEKASGFVNMFRSEERLQEIEATKERKRLAYLSVLNKYGEISANIFKNMLYKPEGSLVPPETKQYDSRNELINK